MDAAWPWWLGSLLLAGTALGYFAALRRPLGVTGLWRQVIGFRVERELARAEASLPADEAALEAMLRAATERAFGPQGDSTCAAPGAARAPAARADVAPRPPARLPWTAALAFLVMLAAGGLLAALARGGLRLRLEPDLGPALGAGGAWLALLLGGVLVGFGARLCAGCTSGHGLNGAARLQPGSLLAVACFFAAGAGVSFALRALGGGGA
ncbi:MAG TPA: YeeE/YedE thiosulfate transporter family protein [Myxococcota bacterium]|nr:YeeE/YedE thiosulfate transporter family protein [Myxococcota bacterium]HRY94334.1 YeeE/YedE thiosulfate transporter family protein [Myxococcota bacterium]HSA21215.1 YeeE/YedE thiosulfate transporter family protein [Myxococcota bacterium]